MTLKIILLLCLTFSEGCIVLAQNTSEALLQDTIHWRANYKLKWQDFEGIPDSNSIGGAGTVSGFDTYAHYTSDSTISVIVRAVFYKSRSWKKQNWKTSYSLNHEQGHFDITEVYAKKATAAFKKYKFNEATVNKDIDSIFHHYYDEMGKIEDIYDKETTYPINRKKQREWDKKIAAWLTEHRTR